MKAMSVSVVPEEGRRSMAVRQRGHEACKDGNSAMKGVCALAMFIALVVMPSLSQGTDWQYLQPSRGGGKIYYDPKSLVPMTGGMVRESFLTEYSVEEIRQARESAARDGLNEKKFDHVTSHIADIEFDCSTKTFRIIRLSYFDREGRRLQVLTYNDKDWQPLQKGSSIRARFIHHCSPAAN